MRWVSMVPSWTETLLECGANVVGRTRYCVHPGPLVTSIQAIGGTKEMDLAKLDALKPDLLLLDREENPKAMAERTGVATHVSNVRGMNDLPMELLAMAQIAGACKEPALAANLERISERWRQVIATAQGQPGNADWARFPGVISWLTPPPRGLVRELTHASKIAYVIWKNPWMCAAEGTFISSVLHAVGINEGQIFSPPYRNLYPTFEMTDLPEGSVALFSSEPYPFGKHQGALLEELRPIADARAFSLAVVDGESFSWFGIRALRFLEVAFGLEPRSGPV